MLLEFTLANSIAEKNTPSRCAYILMNQLVAVHEPPSFQRDDDTPVRRCEVSLRSGQRFEVLESVEDVLDAMKFATRHIGVKPGIADRVDGEKEEVYPWRRGEKVTELARKWRELEKGKANVGRVSLPRQSSLRHPGSRVGSAVVDPHLVAPSPPLFPAESNDEAKSADCATAENTSESSPPLPCPRRGEGRAG